MAVGKPEFSSKSHLSYICRCWRLHFWRYLDVSLLMLWSSRMSSYLPSWGKEIPHSPFPPFLSEEDYKPDPSPNMIEFALCQGGVTQDCWQNICSQVCSYIDCSLSGKWLWPMLSKICCAPLTAHSLPRAWIPQSKFQISLNLFSPGKFFWPTLWERFWTWRKLLIPSIELLFLILYTYFGEEIRNWLRDWEGTDSKATWGNVWPFHCRTLFISRAVPVHSLVLQKIHQLCEFANKFPLQNHCGSSEAEPMCLRWGLPLHSLYVALRFLPPKAEGAQTPCKHRGDPSTAAGEGPCLHSSHFPSMCLLYAPLAPDEMS